MKFYTNQYLEFPNRIAKINKIIGKNLKLRNISFGNTKEGYTFQSYITRKRLEEMLRNGDVKTIAPEKILKLLLHNKEKLK